MEEAGVSPEMVFQKWAHTWSLAQGTAPTPPPPIPFPWLGEVKEEKNSGERKRESQE